MSVRAAVCAPSPSLPSSCSPFPPRKRASRSRRARSWYWPQGLGGPRRMLRRAPGRRPRRPARTRPLARCRSHRRASCRRRSGSLLRRRSAARSWCRSAGCLAGTTRRTGTARTGSRGRRGSRHCCRSAGTSTCARCGSRFSAGTPGPAAGCAAGAGGPGWDPRGARAPRPFWPGWGRLRARGPVGRGWPAYPSSLAHASCCVNSL